MNYRVEPSAEVGGDVVVPGDKSISHRALLLGGIAEGVSRASGFLASEDCLATLRAMSALGVSIDRPSPTEIVVHGVGRSGFTPPVEALDMGNAGTAMRLFMGLLSAQAFDSTLVGDRSLMRRPMERVAAPLRSMGAQIATTAGRPPVVIRGGHELKSIDFAMPLASAQVKSAVLLAGLYAAGTTRVREPAPSRDHTEHMLRAFGVAVEQRGTLIELVGRQTLRAAQLVIPGDISSAAFFLVAGALAAPQGLCLRNVGINPTRTGILTLLRAMGADLVVTEHPGPTSEPAADITVRASRLRGIDVPRDVVPLAIDEFPVFFIAAACAEGTTTLRGAEELRVKESDRLAVMSVGLNTVGVEHELLPDGIRIVGGRRLRGGRVDSHGDHRIAMAFAIASLAADEPIEILDTANVATSFPGFERMAQAVGLRLEVRPPDAQSGDSR
ncbi:MAG: 3-phosphoshikimate 1-carboxyvinyltransferase [Pseudomonadales bacterium]|nr:3-phosphoshikimate 1-carboxyvinyltransferase [Pseudomonadales bacterium]